MSKIHKCKYCGVMQSRVDVCFTCDEKLKLVRKLLAMVRNAKEDVERSKQHESED